MRDPGLSKWCIALKTAWPPMHVRVIIEATGVVVMDLPYTERHMSFNRVLRLARRQVKNHNAPIVKRARKGGINRQQLRKANENQIAEAC